MSYHSDHFIGTRTVYRDTDVVEGEGEELHRMALGMESDPSSGARGGDAPARTANEEIASLVRSQFFVRGICCASEVPTIKGIVKPMHGVSKLNINITTNDTRIF